MPVTLTYSFETEDELRAHLGVSAPTAFSHEPAPARIVTPDPEPAPAVPAPTVSAEPEPAPATDGPTRDDVDADGMPYDETVHSNPPVFKADGLWRAKRGHAKEEQAARAAFKAGGGNAPAPDVSETLGMPGMPASAAPIPDAPEPVDMAKLVNKTMGMMQRGLMTEDTLKGLYQEVVNGDPNVFSTNETARAAMYAKLCEIEPDGPQG